MPETDMTTTKTMTDTTANMSADLGMITPQDVYTVEVYTAPELLALYFTTVGGVLVAGAIVHMLLHYFRRYRT